jgi:hypothetical protein
MNNDPLHIVVRVITKQHKMPYLAATDNHNIAELELYWQSGRHPA